MPAKTIDWPGLLITLVIMILLTLAVENDDPPTPVIAALLVSTMSVPSLVSIAASLAEFTSTVRMPPLNVVAASNRRTSSNSTLCVRVLVRDFFRDIFRSATAERTARFSSLRNQWDSMR